MSKRATRRIVGPLLAVLLALTTGACSSDDEAGKAEPSTEPTAENTDTVGGITEAEAIDIARQRAEDDDPGFDFDSSRPVVIPSGDTYDISFPAEDLLGPGGEPHVVVDRSTGEVVTTYRTR
jgi:hypothetical protein